jgi:hypothetical protein
MKHFLLWISWIVAIAAAANVQTAVPDSLRLAFDETGRARYTLVIQTGKVSLTGICLLKSTPDIIVGSVVNEFGIKAFDFVYTAKHSKVKLHNVAFFLDKWYIRKVVRSDLKYLFASPRKKSRSMTVSVNANRTLLLQNKRHNMSYQFTPLTP